MTDQPEATPPSQVPSKAARFSGVVSSNGGPVTPGANGVHTQPSAETPGASGSAFAAFQYRDYRLLWTGSLFFSVGIWLQMVTLGWLVYDITGSSSRLGQILGIGAIPILLLVPLSGVVADRMNRQRVLVVTQVGMAVLSLGLALILFTDSVRLWHLFGFVILTGICQVFYMPIQQTVLFGVVPREKFPSAVGLMMLSFNLTRVLPLAAGYIIAAVGPEGNFLIQGIAVLGVIVTLLLMKFPPRMNVAREPVLRNLTEGARYVIRAPLVRAMLFIGIVPPLLLIPAFMGIMPVFAKDVIHTGPTGFGLLLSSMGVGGILGALFTASLGRFERRGLLMLCTLVVFSLLILAFSFTRSMATALPVLVVTGFFEMTFFSTSQALLQLCVADEMRGRVISLSNLGMGLMPLGILGAGIGAEHLGAPKMVAICALIALGITVATAVYMPSLRALRLSQLARVNGAEQKL
ncbi:MAG: MFS transporter [Dehalococcoidia bacterium]|nr:MFS transporter [Dehalococcoidia bacterium]